MKKVLEKLFRVKKHESKTSEELIGDMKGMFSYKIHGVETQILEVDLAPFQSIRLEPGSIIYIDQGITMNTSIGPSASQSISRALSGSSLFYIDLTFELKSGSGRVALGSSHYGKILPFNITDIENRFIFANDSYLCSSSEVKISSTFSGLPIGLLEHNVFLQEFSGKGTIFIKAGISPKKITLTENNFIFVAASNLLGFTSEIKCSLKPNLHPQSIVSQKNFLMLKLKGPGEVYIQQFSKDTYETGICQSIMKSMQYYTWIKETFESVHYPPEENKQEPNTIESKKESPQEGNEYSYEGYDAGDFIDSKKYLGGNNE